MFVLNAIKRMVFSAMYTECPRCHSANINQQNNVLVLLRL